LQENYFKPNLLYPIKLSLIIEGEIKTFHDKKKLKQFMTTKPELQKILKVISHTEDEDELSHERMGISKSRR
jgi:hypothetical protein